MLDAVTLDQLRTFVAAIDTGSFSAAGRQLGRAQSVVSQTIGTLEDRLGVSLFNRERRLPIPTDQGRALVEPARSAIASMDAFKATARGLSKGLEPELSITVDVMFPIDILTIAVTDFQREFPDTPLRLFVEVLGAVLQPVIDGRCSFGIAGSLPYLPSDLTLETILGIRMRAVAAPHHVLAKAPSPISADRLNNQVQLVLTDRSNLSEGREFGVLSGRTWRLADLGAKHAFLRAGLGWGAMPRHLIADDVNAGQLVELTMESSDPALFTMQMGAVYRADTPPGPAGRWLIHRVQEEAAGFKG